MVISPRLRRAGTRLAWVVLWVASTLLVALQFGRPLYYTDGRGEVAATALVGAGMVVYGTPEARVELPGPVVGRVAVLPDGQLVYGRSTESAGCELVRFDPARPSLPPEPLHALNTPHHELAPAFGADGRLYFASDRPGGAGGYDLYAARWLGAGFGPVEALTVGNSALDECDPAPAPDGARLVFVRRDAPRDAAAPGVLWRCELAAGGAPVPVWPQRAGRTPSADDRDPVFTADGSALWFVRRRGGAPLTVHRASFCGGAFDDPVAIGREWGTGELCSPLPWPGLGLGLLQLPRAPEASALWFHAQGRELPPWWPGQRWLTWLLAGLAGFAALLLVLLHYGQRWRALDLLAQCLLLSLLLHVLLALWLWGVELANGPLPGRTEPGGFEVRLVATTAGSASADAAAEGAALAALAAAQYTPTERTLDTPAPGTGLPAVAGPPTPAAAAWQPATQDAQPTPAPAMTLAAAAALPPLFAEDDAAAAFAAPAMALPAAPASAASHLPPAAATAGASLDVVVPPPAMAAVLPPALAGERASAHLPAPQAPVAQASARPVPAPVPALAAPEGVSAADAAAPAAVADGPTPLPLAPELALAPAAAAAASAALTAPAAAAPTGTAAAAVPPLAMPVSALLAAPGAVATPVHAPAPAAVAAAAPRHVPAQVALRVPPPLPGGGTDLADFAAGAPAAVAGPAPPAERVAGPQPAPVASAGPLPSPLVAAQPVPAPGSALPRGAPAASAARNSAPMPLVSAGERRRSAPAPTPRGAAATAAAAPDPAGAAAEPVAVGPGAVPRRPDLPGLSGPLAATARSAPPPGQSPPLPPLPLPGSALRRAAAALAAPGPAAVAAAPAATPYSNRFGPAKARALEQFGGTAATERAVAAGLAYLARIQNRDGTWGDPQHFDDKYGNLFVGKTALCALAFLGAGHTPASASEHSAVVAKALAALLRQQDARTGAFGASSCYGHGIATYALAECHALTRDPALRAPLEAALRWIVQNQGPRRDLKNRGGWGYFSPGLTREDDYARVSVTAWMVMALESARLSGVAVPDPVLPRAREYLEQSFDAPNGWFRYNQKPSRLASAWPTLPASTPAGAFCLLLLGAPRDDAKVQAALDYTVTRAPTGYRRFDDDTFVLRGQGNVYFWYYGSLCAFLAGGTHWTAWNERLRAVLPPAQAADGSFPPIDAYAREAGDDEQDRSYTTAMCVLCLQVYYRYFTPLLLGR
jgi:hypothetical protein